MASMAASCGFGDESLLMRRGLKFRVKVNTMRRVNSRRLPKAEVPDVPAKHMARSEHDLAPLPRGLRALRSSASCNCVPERESRTATCTLQRNYSYRLGYYTSAVQLEILHARYTDNMQYEPWHPAKRIRRMRLALTGQHGRKERSMTQTNQQNPMAA